MFAGSGTVGLVAKNFGRHYILFDNSEEYCKLANKRIKIAEKKIKQITNNDKIINRFFK